MKDIIYVLDFGSQYSHLITKRIREAGVYAELVSSDFPTAKLAQSKGVILSGGPQNLSEKTALRVDKKVFELGIPVLGICYGMQLTAFMLGGKVRAGKYREYGGALVTISKFSKIFGVQFHPEVLHTTNGNKILTNFIKITGAKKSWREENFINESIKKIKKQIGSDRAVCGLSGGVDSAVAATIVHRAIGKNLTCIYVDTGLMREGETTELKKVFKTYMKMNLRIIYAEKEFLKKLKGVTDPEKKRKAIGELFIRIFEREAKKLPRTKWLVQGTLYTDGVSSGVSSGGKHTAVIKSHHNVGGLPEKMGFKLIEPLRDLYKYEVRKIGGKLGLPKKIVYRTPFPGPGLGIRIIGEVTRERLKILKQADAIVCSEIEQSGENSTQHFAVLPIIRSVGVQGDGRSYAYPIIIRSFTTDDFLTVQWAFLSHKLLAKISSRITNEVKGINRVVYDITSKPPGTIEWE